MTILPIAARELLVQARRKSTYWVRMVASAIAFLLMCWLMIIGGLPIPTVNQGQMLFGALAAVAFVYCLFVGVLVTADCLSAEKREGTLGLIFLTDLKGYDVVFGKLVSCSVHSVYGLLAVVPVMSLAFLFGGVTGPEVARVTLVLANTMFFSLAAGMYVSTASHNDRKAIFAALLLILVVTAGPILPTYLCTKDLTDDALSMDLAASLMLPSPLLPMVIAQTNAFGAFRAGAFYSSLAMTNLIAWALLWVACRRLPRVCHEGAPGIKRKKWNDWWRKWRVGNPIQRASFRRRMLDRNACLWLASREQYWPAGPWVLILPLAAIGFWSFLKYREVFGEAALGLVFTIQVLLKVWCAAEICNRWVEDRRAGALELMLSTPLGVHEMMRGQMLALRRQFGWPFVATAILTLLVWRGSAVPGSSNTGRTWVLLSLVVFVADLAALRWVAAWVALRSRGLSRALLGTLGRILWLRWFILVLCIGVASLWEWIGNWHPQANWEPWFWFALALSFDVLFGYYARWKFLKDFRQIAADPAASTSWVAPAPVKPVPTESVSRWAVWTSSRRVRRNALFTAVGLVILGVPLARRYSLHLKIEHRLAAMRQAGIPTTVAELDQHHPLVADDVNAASILQRIAARLVPMNSLPKFITTNLPQPNHSEPPELTEEMKQAIHALLTTNQTALSMLRDGPSLSLGHYAQDWGSFMGGSASTQYRTFIELDSVLRLEALLAFAEGDTPQAMTSLRRLWQLGQSLEREAGPQWQRLRMAKLTQIMVTLERGLNLRSLPSADLAELQAELSRAETAVPVQQILNSFQCLIIRDLQSPQFGSSSQAELIRERIRKQVDALTGITDRRLLGFLAGVEEFNGGRQNSWAQRLKSAQALADRAPAPSPNNNSSWLNGDLSFRLALTYAIRPTAEFTARCRATMLGLAVERFRNLHQGELPAKLEELAPTLISEIPRDPFDDQPMRYQKLERGFRVYSVGPNGKDDGGDGTLSYPLPRSKIDDITFSIQNR